MDENEVSAQGITDIFKLLDPNIINKLSQLLNKIDIDKITDILDTIQVDNNYICIKLDIKIK